MLVLKNDKGTLMQALRTRRRSIEVPGLDHGDAPIPMGARIGSVIYSSGISGREPYTRSYASEPVAQARQAFQNLRAFLAAADASLQDVVRLTVYLKSNDVRAAVNAEWLECFPDPGDRPARHILIHDLPGSMLVQLEVVAVIDQDANA